MATAADAHTVPTPVVWFTGLSGSGKTTLAQALAARLRAAGCVAVVLDGDQLRQGLSRDLGFAPTDRREQARRCAELAALLADNGIVAIVALVSPAAADRAQARAIIGSERFHEVYLDASVAVCAARDPKGLYARARAGDLAGLTGIDAPYDVPAQPALVINTTTIPVTASLQAICGWLRSVPTVTDLDI